MVRPFYCSISKVGGLNGGFDDNFYFRRFYLGWIGIEDINRDYILGLFWRRKKESRNKLFLVDH